MADPLAMALARRDPYAPTVPMGLGSARGNPAVGREDLPGIDMRPPGGWWPERMAQAAWGGLTLPGDVAAGRTDPWSNEGISRAADLAGIVTLGSGAVPRAAGELRSGVGLPSSGATVQMPDWLGRARVEPIIDGPLAGKLRFDGLPETTGGANNGWAIVDPSTGEVVRAGNAYSVTPTADAIEAAKRLASGLSREMPSGIPQREFFARYGDLPPGGRSTDFSTGRREAGTSVFTMRRDYLNGNISVVPYGSAPSYLWLVDRPLYEVSGKVIGYGADGEPLLRGAKINRMIDPSELNPKPLERLWQTPAAQDSFVRMMAAGLAG